MSVIRLGSTLKFSEGWDNIFGGGKKSKAAVASKPASGQRKAASKKAQKSVVRELVMRGKIPRRPPYVLSPVVDYILVRL